MAHTSKLLNAAPEERHAVIHSMESVDVWQALRTGVGAYAACPRCFESCPVEEDYPEHLHASHNRTPEATPQKRQRLRAMVAAERQSDQGLLEHSRRWVGRTRLDGACPEGEEG